jgi:hypothetical protein
MFRERFVICGAGLALAATYGFLAYQSSAVSTMDLLYFLGAYWVAAGVLLICWFYHYERDIQPTLGDIILWAVVFRIIGIFGSPVLEDDFYRYLLDGCVFVSSGSPYGIAPSELFNGNALSPECQSALNWVNNPDLPTIYGPLLQYLFALSHLASPADINFLQIIVVIFDLILIMTMSRFVSHRLLMLYAWCPLILKEIAFTAHPDIVGVCFLFGAFAMRFRGQHLNAAILVALACGAKIFAFLALPFFLYRKGPKVWLTVFGVLIGLYLPFIAQGQTNMLVVGIFAQRWTFNPILFDPISVLLPDLDARILCLALFVTFWCYYFYRYSSNGDQNRFPRMDWIFGIFFVLSPVINPWYLIWLLPFATLRPSLWAWTASLVISLSYVIGLNLVESNLGAYQIDPYARTLQIGLICLALARDYRQGRFKFP